MTEAAFPVLGATFVLLFVLPVSALLTKLALVLLERGGARGPLDKLSTRYVLLTASSALPLAWFMSAGVHQAETGRSALACLLDHDNAALCFEPAFFASLLAGATAFACIRATQRARKVAPSSSQAGRVLSELLERLVVEHAALAGLRGRFVTTDQADFTIATMGLFVPRVFVGVGFANKLTNNMLASALAHEAEHVHSRDPLRYLLLDLALAINPFGRFLLAPHMKRWRAAREAHCDREAVLHGAAPLPLADAIVRAARPALTAAAPLGASETSVLKLRIGMLVAFSEQAPRRCKQENRGSMPLTLVLLVGAILLPHQVGTSALDVLHTAAERALTYLLF